MNGWRADTIAAEAAFQASQAFFLAVAASAALGAGAGTLDVDAGCWATSPDGDGLPCQGDPSHHRGRHSHHQCDDRQHPHTARLLLRTELRRWR